MEKAIFRGPLFRETEAEADADATSEKRSVRVPAIRQGAVRSVVSAACGTSHDLLIVAKTVDILYMFEVVRLPAEFHFIEISAFLRQARKLLLCERAQERLLRKTGMNLYKKRFGSALVLVAGLMAGSVATATPITMNFDGLTPGASVSKYYDGGCSRLLGFKADCHGQDYGVAWKNAIVGSSANGPSLTGFAGLLFKDNATMNVKAGFDGGLSFFYFNDSNLLFQGGVSVYSGLNGHGTRLSSVNLGRSTDWKFFDLTFSGLAKSVIFDGSPLFFTGFDDVTLGVSAPGPVPVPEPRALGVFGLGVLLMGLFAGFRRRYS